MNEHLLKALHHQYATFEEYIHRKFFGIEVWVPAGDNSSLSSSSYTQLGTSSKEGATKLVLRYGFELDVVRHFADAPYEKLTQAVYAFMYLYKALEAEKLRRAEDEHEARRAIDHAEQFLLYLQQKALR